MKAADFQALVAKHGGVAGVSIVDPHVETETPNIDPTGQPIRTKEPNPTPKYKYVFNDGTEVEAITRPTGDVDLTDPGKALAPGAGAKEPDRQTFPDGSLRERQPDGSWRTLQEKPAAVVPAEKGSVPAINLPASRAGQRTDLTLVEQQANAFIAQLNADKTLTPEERTRRLTAYVETNVKPAVAQATVEATAEQDRLLRRQTEADAASRATAARADRREERLDTTADRTAAEARRVGDRNFAYKAGQDAVDNAMKLMPYRVGSGYNDAFAGALNSMGGPQISGRALDVQMPDFTAIARQAAEQSYAMHGAPVGQPGQAPMAPPPPGLATLPVAPPAPVAPGYAPPPMAMPPSVGGNAAPPGVVPMVNAGNRDLWGQ